MCDRDRLILDNLNLARWHANRKQYRKPAVSYEDLYQAACIGLIKAADTWDENQAPFGVWATLFIRREIRAELRRMLHTIRVPRTVPWDDSPQREPLEDMEQEPREPPVEIAEQMACLLSRLSPQTRKMMRLHFERDWPATQIAAVFGCSHTTVDNRITRAIALLRKAQ